jgi:hypothetical protein
MEIQIKGASRLNVRVISATMMTVATGALAAAEKKPTMPRSMKTVIGMCVSGKDPVVETAERTAEGGPDKEGWAENATGSARPDRKARGDDFSYTKKRASIADTGTFRLIIFSWRRSLRRALGDGDGDEPVATPPMAGL